MMLVSFDRLMLKKLINTLEQKPKFIERIKKICHLFRPIIIITLKDFISDILPSLVSFVSKYKGNLYYIILLMKWIYVQTRNIKSPII